MRQEVERSIKQAEPDLENARKNVEIEAYELGAPLGVPGDLRKHLVYLNADYTTARYPDAANGIPYEIYDRETAESKVDAAEALFEWLRSLVT